MNREFVNIKVDREGTPRCRSRLHDFCASHHGSGGWPMSVWVNAQPSTFVGGTYFPPDDRYGQPGSEKCFERIAAAASRLRSLRLAQSRK